MISMFHSIAESNQITLNSNKTIPCKARNLVSDCKAQVFFKAILPLGLVWLWGCLCLQRYFQCPHQPHKSMQMISLLYHMLGNSLTHEEYSSTSARYSDSVTSQISASQFSLKLKVDPQDVRDQEACKCQTTTSCIHSIAQFSNACELQKANPESHCLHFDRLDHLMHTNHEHLCHLWCLVKICHKSCWSISRRFWFMHHVIYESWWAPPVQSCSSCSRCTSRPIFVCVFFLGRCLQQAALSHLQRYWGLRCRATGT